MRYWAYLAAKLAVAAAVFYGLLLLIGMAWPGPPPAKPAEKPLQSTVQNQPPPQLTLHVQVPNVRILEPDAVLLVAPPTANSSGTKGNSALRPLNDGLTRLWFNLAMMGWFVLAVGALYLILWDQRYRCRTCLRRVRMPIETGSWGRMLLLGRPRIEYICPYGHGTLKEDELQISGRENPEWTPQSENIWDELCASVMKDNEKQK
jgi:disulfide bond formation protein DsbB